MIQMIKNLAAIGVLVCILFLASFCTYSLHKEADKDFDAQRNFCNAAWNKNHNTVELSTIEKCENFYANRTVNEPDCDLTVQQLKAIENNWPMRCKDQVRYVEEEL
jgi:hypothetical protein